MLTAALILATILTLAALAATAADGPRTCLECGDKLWPWQAVKHAEKHWGAS